MLEEPELWVLCSLRKAASMEWSQPNREAMSAASGKAGEV